MYIYFFNIYMCHKPLEKKKTVYDSINISMLEEVLSKLIYNNDYQIVIFNAVFYELTFSLLHFWI